nr:MAG: protein of unknown function (DUF5351) [Bacteriophage sp.]
MLSPDLAQVYKMNDKKRVYIRTDRNGTKYFADYTCKRCGGQGGLPQWIYTGYTCYECGGTGVAAKPEIFKEYTPEYAAKLEERRSKAREKKRLERIEQIKNKLPEIYQDHGFSSEGKIYVVTGNTYEIREELKAAGAKWFSALRSWGFTEDTDKYPTVQISFDECYTVDMETGCVNWNYETGNEDLIKSKMPKVENSLESSFIGSIGDKLDQVVTFVRYFEYERDSYSGWGKEIARIYKFVDEHGNILIWNTGSWKTLQEGKRYNLKGKIKEHNTYNGENQTILTRCTITKVEEA